jgi:tetratricopeptide (TPR) repeat protein
MRLTLLAVVLIVLALAVGYSVISHPFSVPSAPLPDEISMRAEPPPVTITPMAAPVNTVADDVAVPLPRAEAIAIEREGEVEYRDGMKAFSEGRFREAGDLLARGVSFNPRAMTALGVAHYMLEDYPEARRALEVALPSATGDEAFIARKFLAMIYYREDDIARSLDRAREALAMRDDRELRSLRDRLLRESRSQASFVSEESDHFRAVYDGYAHGSVDREILGILEDAYRDLGGKLGHFPDQTISVILYGEEQFRDATEMPGWVLGVYDGKIRIPVKGLPKADDPALRRLLYHEYVHALVFSITRNCPVWVNEGLAEYLSEGPAESLLGQAIPLSSLDRAFPRQGGRVTAAAYRVSHEAVTSLMHEHGENAMRRFLESTAEGMGTADAFELAFRTQYRDFLDRWGK